MTVAATITGLPRPELKVPSAPVLKIFLNETQIVEMVEQVRSTSADTAPSEPSTSSARQLIVDALAPAGDPLSQTRASILADLLFAALQQSVSMSFSARQTSVFLSVIKLLHEDSVRHRLTIEASFSLLQELMLRFTVHRPPFSEGVFSAEQAHACMRWLLDGFYRLYKLHMYAFTKRVTKDLRLGTIVLGLETVPAFILEASLQNAVPWEEHEAQVAAEAAKAEEEARAEQERMEQEAEERKKRELEEAYAEAMPDEIERKVKAVLDREIERMREQMEGKYKEEHEQLREQLKALQT